LNINVLDLKLVESSLVSEVNIECLVLDGLLENDGEEHAKHVVDTLQVERKL
jgi:hypothetical protein